MKIDYEKLKNGLEQLNGNDYIEAEHEAKHKGDTSIEPTFSKTFQAVVAAKALGVEYEAITKLKFREFTTVTLAVFVFLGGSMAEAEKALP